MGCVFFSPFQRADTRIESEPFVVKNNIGDGRGSQREAAGFHRVYREHTDLSRVFSYRYPKDCLICLGKPFPQILVSRWQC
jgi:hypothetical protein